MLDDVARFDLRRQVGRHRRQQRHLALAQVGADRLRVPQVKSRCFAPRKIRDSSLRSE